MFSKLGFLDVNGIGLNVCLNRIPRELFEDALIPLLEECGRIYDLRLMMDNMTGYNRGFAFITFSTRQIDR